MDLRQERILVTGGHGFLGNHILDKLRARGVPEAQIFAPSREELDLRKSEDAARAVKNISVVIHAAGITGDTEFHRDHPGSIFYDNLIMGVELMEAARQAGVKKFVTIGSATEYPENAPLPFGEENLWIGYPEAVHAPYTVAKKMLLVQAQAYRAQYGFNAIHLLLTNMYGPGKEAHVGFVVANIIRRMLTAERTGAKSIEAWGTGTPTRDFLYVADAAEGILLAVEKYDKPEPVNLGSGWELSIRELTETIAQLTNYTGTIAWNAAKPDGQMRRMLNISRAEKEFGFRPATSIAEGLKQTIAWQKAHPIT